MMTRFIEADKVYAIDKFPISERMYDDKVISLEADLTKKVSLPKGIDCIVSTEFIEHITKEQFLNLLVEVKKCLKADGKFIGSTPNKICPTTNPYHLYEFTLGELTEILKEHFKEVESFDNGQNCIIWNANTPLL